MIANEADIPLLVDTSVVSLLFKPNDARTRLYLPELRGRLLAVSFVTVGELHRWAIQRRWGRQKTNELRERLNSFVAIPYNDAVSLQWAGIQARTPKSDNDAWVAACAIVYGCSLVTDDSDFQGIQGLHVICHR